MTESRWPVWPGVAGVVPAHTQAPGPGEPVPSHYERCFGCGPEHPTGLHMQSVAGDGASVVSSIRVSAWHEGAAGLIHGGLLAAAFDDAFGKLLVMLRRPAVTAHLETDFRRPVPVGSLVVMRSWCEAYDGRKMHGAAQAHLDDLDGPVLATARALFLTVDLTHFADHGSDQGDRLRDAYGSGRAINP